MQKTISYLTTFYLILFVSTSLFAQERKEVGNLVMENIPEIPPTISERLLQYENTRSAFFSDWLPDGEGMLISTRFGNTTQLHLLKQPMGAREQITFFEEPVYGGSFSPMKKYQDGFFFNKDIGGNENKQLFWFDLTTSTAEMISDGETITSGPTWSNKGDQFVIQSTRRNKKDFDLYISSMDDPKTAKLIVSEGNGVWWAGDWSPDDSKLLLGQYISSNKANIYVYDIAKESLSKINDDSESMNFGIAWHKDGDKFYMGTDHGQEFVKLASYDLNTKETTIITQDINWGLAAEATRKDRSQMAFTVNENGFSQLYLLNTADNSYKKVPNLPIGQIYGFDFHPTKNEMAMVLNSSKSPGDIYALDLDSFELNQWTKSEIGGLNTDSFPVPELIEYETFDEVDGKKRKIPAFLYKSKNPLGASPVLINIHGGPEGQHRPYFSAMRAYLTNELGISIIAPNVRGSTGYGSSYLKLDNGYKREDSVKDIGALLDWIEQEPTLDAKRVGVAGGSYGGYMSLACMFHYNDRLSCGVDAVGISNFVTFLENTKEYRQDLRRVEYGDERDPKMRAFLDSISPTTNAHKIKKPLFVIQGANDPRVPASEAEQMVQKVRDNEGEVWYLLAKDEGHGFRKKENVTKLNHVRVLFLEKFLLGKTEKE